MKKTIAVNTDSPYFTGVVALLLGIVMVLFPQTVVDFSLDIIGWFLILLGGAPLVYALIKKYPVSLVGVIYLLAGILILIFKTFFVNILMGILGAILILAAFQQFNIIAARKQSGYNVHMYVYIYPVVLLLAGVITLINPFSAMGTLVVFFGCGLLFFGITMVLNRFLLK